MASGAGVLSTSVPETEAMDSYLYDTAEPVPSYEGTLLFYEADSGPADQRPDRGWDDVLCYSTEGLTEPLEVIGVVTATLFVSSSAVDTDFTAKLVDIFQDGCAIILCDGIVRMRCRESLANPTMVEPGRIYEITVGMPVTSNIFLPGHRLQVEVSRSNSRGMTAIRIPAGSWLANALTRWSLC